jgi:uncharacterized membrane protein YeiH
MAEGDTGLKRQLARLLLSIDLSGTFVFAVEGAMAAITGGLDLLGVMVLAFSTALGGGIIRDLLIGAAPPASIRDWHYPTIAFAGATAAFLFHGAVAAVPADVIVVFDAAGLSLCAIAGAMKASAYGLHPIIAVMMGMITGCGGGTIRDVLLARVPGVLRTDVYATAAAAGAAVLILGLKLRLNPTATAILGGLVCFGLRLLAHWEHWNLPRALGN